MRTLIETGWTASEAARAITAGEVDPSALVHAETGPDSPGRGPAVQPPDHRIALIARFLAAAEANSVRDTEAVLDEIQGSGSYEAVVDDLLLPAAAALGDAWADGRLSVAGEHAASAAVGRRLSAVFQGAGAPGRATVVVGLPPGSRHELGALAFAAALQRRGVGVLYLGADVTVDGWVDAVRRTGARGAVIGVVTDSDRASSHDLVATLLEHDVALVAVGGAAASLPPSTADRVLMLPDGVVDAAARVADAVRGRRR
jgi:methanogenic corrinoid protein MtbC1